jgi:hypothetical protein
MCRLIYTIGFFKDFHKFCMCCGVSNPHTAKTKYRNFKTIFPEKEYRDLSPNFHIHASVSDLYIPMIGLPILLEEIYRPILGLVMSNQRFLKIVCFRFPTNVPLKIEYIRF